MTTLKNILKYQLDISTYMYVYFSVLGLTMLAGNNKIK